MIKSAVQIALLLSTTIAAPASAQVDAEPRGRSADKDWSRVRALDPGKEIGVSLGDSSTVERLFVSADESTLTLLNLTDSPQVAKAARTLPEIVSRHPEYFTGAAKGRTYLVDNLRLSPEGVFVADSKVAELQRVIETSERRAVAEIKIRQRGRGFWGHLGPLGGNMVGGFVGGLAAGFACQAAAGRNRCDSGAFLVGMVVGGLVGGTYGFHAARRETEEVLYRGSR